MTVATGSLLWKVNSYIKFWPHSTYFVCLPCDPDGPGVHSCSGALFLWGITATEIDRPFKRPDSSFTCAT